MLENWQDTNFKALDESAKTPLQGMRREAFAHFTRLGFPTPRQEEWKYTNVAGLQKTNFGLTLRGKMSAPSPAQLQSVRAGLSNELCAVFVDGFFSAEASQLKDLPQGMRVKSLADYFAGQESDTNLKALIDAHLGRYVNVKDEAFVSMNTAFLQDGLVIHLAKNTVCKAPLEVVFWSQSESRAVYPRVLIIAEPGSAVQVVEIYAARGQGAVFTNPVAEIVVAEGARVEHTKVNLEAAAAFHIGIVQVRQEKTSVFTSNSFSFGGGVVRNDINSVLAGERAEAHFHGLYLGCGTQHVDHHTLMDHATPHCQSNELYKGILAGRAKGVFNGKVMVRQIAQKTNAFQSNKNLLLSREASIDTKPQLEIFADDVKCTHGATIGRLDEESLFYLRCRGIDFKTARQMLIRAFASDVVSRVGDETLRGYLENKLTEKLQSSDEFFAERV